MSIRSSVDWWRGRTRQRTGVDRKVSQTPVKPPTSSPVVNLARQKFRHHRRRRQSPRDSRVSRDSGAFSDLDSFGRGSRADELARADSVLRPFDFLQPHCSCHRSPPRDSRRANPDQATTMRAFAAIAGLGALLGSAVAQSSSSASRSAAAASSLPSGAAVRLSWSESRARCAAGRSRPAWRCRLPITISTDRCTGPARLRAQLLAPSRLAVRLQRRDEHHLRRTFPSRSRVG